MSYNRVSQSKAKSRDFDSDSEDDSGSESATEGRGYRLQDLSSSRTTGNEEFSIGHRGKTISDIDGTDDFPSGLERTGSGSTAHSFMLYTPDEEHAVKRKLDRRLVLFVAFLYMLSFLDRSNIGNAKVAGMSKDLELSSGQFEWLLKAFYIMYISFEWMTLLWKVFRPSVYLAVCVCSWGVIASLQSLVSSFGSMLILRALLGIGEAAFVGIPFYLSFFYKRDELAFRTGLFISAAPLATSFAGTLAWCIIRFGDHVPIASWRILLLVEGFPSVVVAVFVYWHIPDGPDKAKYLSPRQRKVARDRLRKEADVAGAGEGDGKGGLRWKDIREALVDPKCYLTAAMFFCCNVSFSSLPVFLPTIIKEMGFTALQSQALSAPPHLVAFLTVLLTAYLSDHTQTRSPFIIFHSLLACAGYSMMAVSGSYHASAKWRYIGVYPATMGFFSAITIIITWTLNNQHSSSGKGTGLAILNYVGQIGPLVGVHLYPDSDAPYYVPGMAACAGFMAVVAVLALVLRVILVRKNRFSALQARSNAGEGEGEDEELFASEGGDGGGGGGEEEGAGDEDGDMEDRKRKRIRRRQVKERFVYMI